LRHWHSLLEHESAKKKEEKKEKKKKGRGMEQFLLQETDGTATVVQGEMELS
jgi:hypothetical protein